MEKMRFAASLALGAMLAARNAGAVELWEPHQPGLWDGLETAAAPPPGFYGIMNQVYGTFDERNGSGHQTGTKVDTLFEVPILVWQSGTKIFGGTYSASVAVPFDYTNIGEAASPVRNGHGLYNTVIVPAQLSWKLPNDFYAKAGLTIDVDDASSSFAHPPAGGGVGSGNGYWTVQPDLTVSWLHAGWNVSMSLHYAINSSDDRYHFGTGVYDYRSGDVLAGDYVAIRTVGKWKFGVSGYSETQLTPDSGAGAVLVGCPKNDGCQAATYGAGPLVGYNFGGISGSVEYNFPIFAKNDLGGQRLNVRVVIPF